RRIDRQRHHARSASAGWIGGHDRSRVGCDARRARWRGLGRLAGTSASAAARSSGRQISMTDLRIPIFAVGALLLFLSACAQASLVYIDRARLRHMLEEGTPRAAALARLLEEPTSTLSTILVIYTLSLCAAAAAAFWLDVDIWSSVAPWLATVLAVLEVLVLLLVQFLGRVVAVARPEQVALTFVR